MSNEVAIQVLQRVLNGFNDHDIDAIMANFAEDCVFESPRGPDPWGRRFVGKAEVRRGLAARFEGSPTSTAVRTITSRPDRAGSPSGRSRAPRSAGIGSRFVVATSGGSEMTASSSGRTASGSSANPRRSGQAIVYVSAASPLSEPAWRTTSRTYEVFPSA